MSNTTEIASILQSCINASGDLYLPGTALGSATMAAAFSAYLPGAQLVLTGATVLPPTSTVVTVTGTGATLFSALTVTATFTPTAGGDVAVVVTGVTAGGYCLTSAFPCLAGGTFNQVPFNGGGTLTLDTLPAGGGAATLLLDGTLQITGVIENIAAFLAGIETIPVAGPIQVFNQTIAGVQTQTPSFALSAPIGQNLTVGTLTGNFTLNLVSTPFLANVYNPDTGQVVPTYVTNAGPTVTTALTFSAGGSPMTVTATMAFTPGTSGFCGSPCGAPPCECP